MPAFYDYLTMRRLFRMRVLQASPVTDDEGFRTTPRNPTRLKMLASRLYIISKVAKDIRPFVPWNPIIDSLKGYYLRLYRGHRAFATMRIQRQP